MSKEINNNQGNGALELIIMRNSFYRDNFRRAWLALVLMFAINCVLAVTIIYKVMNPPAPQYFATTADGRMINWHPLSDPVVTDDFVLQWSANAVRKAFSLDYMHWRQQLQDASTSFTPLGWKYFLQSLKQSNNLDTLTSLKMVSDAVVTGAPQILEQMVADGVYAWKVQMPILVTYANVGKSIPMPMDITLIVLRVPVEQSADRIAINNFLPVPQQTTDQKLMGGGS